MNKLYLYLYLTLFISLNSASQINNLTPFQIPDLQLWLRSDSLVSLNQDSVYQWSDVSGNIRNASQSNKSFQPIYIGNVFKLNNKPIIKFDGLNDFMDFPSLNVKTVFILVKHEVPSTSYNTLLGNSTSYRWHGGVNQNLFNSYVETSNIINGQGYLNGNNILPVNMEKPAEYSIIELFPSNPHPAERITGDNPGDNGASFWKGDFAEIIIYDRTLTNTERTQVEDYLFLKYAPPVVLPNDININNSFCDTIISPSGYYTNYLWSTGATTSSISVNTSGKYWVRATNIFGKTSSDTILVSYPGNFLSQNSILCQGDSIVWNTNLPNNPYTFQWQDSTTDSTFTIKQGGQYYVKVTDGNGCSVNSNTITITQDNFPTIASLGSDTTKLCAGNSISLVSGSAPLLTYTWSTSSNNDSLFINTSGTYSVIVTNTNNCVAKDTIIVKVNGFAPTANFTTTIGCINSPVIFNDLSLAPSSNTITSYNWDFGDNTSATNTSTLSNPSHTYTNTGTYNVTLKITTNVSCDQTIIKTITVSPIPTALFINGISCQNDSTVFANQSTSTAGYSITSILWNFGDGTNISNSNTPKHLFSNQATYSVSLIATNNVGCSSAITKTISVRAQVKANFTTSAPCSNTPIIFQSTSLVPSAPFTPSYSWNFGASTPTTSKSFTNSGVYNITLSVDGQNGCTSSITKLITVFLPPSVNFSIPSFCIKDTVITNNLSTSQSGVISSYNWKLNNSFFSSITNPSLTISNAGNYNIRLTAVNSFGCKDSITKSITAFALPNVDFTTFPASFYYINSPINFIPNIGNAISYNWNISTIPSYTIQSPTISFNTEGTYTVSLNLKDTQGCKNSKTKTITVSKRQLDLAILNVTTQKGNDDFMTVNADIANFGSVPITTFDMHYQISDAGNIKETWNGILNPNTFYSYTFSAKSASQKNSSNNITCVDIEKVNGTLDDNLTNNSFCNTLNVDDIFVSNPIPNPTDGDITLPITLNRVVEYSITIYNSIGQVQREETTTEGFEGLNFVTLPTTSYARGCYIIKVMIDGKTFIKKFIKTGAK